MRHDPAAHGAQPTIGRLVHYVLEHGPAKGEHRPALIVAGPWGEDGTANLQVFLDTDELGRHNDAPSTWPEEYRPDGLAGLQLFWATSRQFDAEKAPGTWHWPERV